MTPLNARVIEIVKQTVPILQEHGETLTRHFYQRMFTHDPQVKALFNPAHQHAGTQQRALAAAVCAYAQHIETPAALADAVELIAQKHVSLGIKPEHYPIVGKHLLGSIREVLGAGATDEVIDAWAAAYGMLAEILIDRETAIYREHEDRHGWSGFRPFVVERKVMESDAITSFYLRPADGSSVRPYLPGQYLTVRLPIGDSDGQTTMRNYSISFAPSERYYRISVKRESPALQGAPAGYVSNFLHERINPGDTVEVGPPCGEFTLDPDVHSDRPLVLLSGGVGITPTMAMLHAIVTRQPDRSVVFIHGALDGRSHAFGSELRQISDKHPRVKVHIRFSNPAHADQRANAHDSEGFIDQPLIRSLVPDPDADFYYCGPKPFMALVHQALTDWGVSDDRLHYEFFGPKQELETTGATAGV